MKFSEVLESLRNGERLTNATLSNNNSFICRQVPQAVDKTIIPKMSSLPEVVKEFLKDRGDICYHDQVLLVEWDSVRGAYMATSYIPTWFDIFREDWTIC